MKKQCVTCKENLPFERFALNKTKSDGLQNKCKSCVSLYNANHHKANKSRYAKTRAESRDRIKSRNRKSMIEFLQDKSCVDCGNADIRVLEFDHLKDKEHGISELMNGSWEKLLAEVDKCEIVCCNCHRIRTLGRLKSYRWMHVDAGSQGG